MWAIARTGTSGWEYFSYDKSMTSPEGGWSSDKVLALAFATEKSAKDFHRKQLMYAFGAEVQRISYG